MKNIPSFFRLAKNISKLSNHKQKMGAVVVKNGKPISVGYNQIKSNPTGWRGCLHAEQYAIKYADIEDFHGCSIYVYRQRPDGNIGLSRPCRYCLEELKKKGFRWMYYSTNEFPFWDYERI
jgi:pyrimidine deaminase RibD-like protein